MSSTSHAGFGPAQHQHCVAQRLHPEPTSLRIHTDKVTHMGKLVAAVQYLQLRNGTWNTPCTEHNTSRSKLLALMEVAALNSQHQVTAGLFINCSPHILSPWKKKSIMRKDKKMLNKTILKKNSWFCAGSQVWHMPEGLCVATSPLMGLERQR